MAQRRMFSLKVIDTDMFLDMPLSSRLLYYDLSMRADDDGFVASPKKIQRMVGCSDDDMRLLTAKQFIIPFESGICVIKHWRIHNYIQKDRYDETQYLHEKSQLSESENGTYQLMNTKCIQNVSNMDTQVRLEIGKDRLGKDIYSTHVLLTQIEYEKLCAEYTEPTVKDYIERLNDYIEQIGTKAADKKYKSHYATIRNWYRKDKDTKKTISAPAKPKFNNCESRTYQPDHGEQFIEQPKSTTDDEIAKALEERRKAKEQNLSQ